MDSLISPLVVILEEFQVLYLQAAAREEPLEPVGASWSRVHALDPVEAKGGMDHVRYGHQRPTVHAWEDLGAPLSGILKLLTSVEPITFLLDDFVWYLSKKPKSTGKISVTCFLKKCIFPVN